MEVSSIKFDIVANIHFIMVSHFLFDEMQMTCFKFNSLLMQNLTMVMIKSIHG
jgi:hypothetical protein